jgi:cell division protein FtsN
MESNKRLYVFDKKEVLLVFILVILISTTCFVFGVKMGKNYSLGVEGIIQSDIERVDLLSQKEEKILEDEKILEEMVKKVEIENVKGDQQAVDPSYDILKNKIDKEVTGQEEVKDVLDAVEKKKETLAQTYNKSPIENAETQSNNVSGKWTVQLGSHQNTEDAEAFADGFRVRGYKPIINQVYLGDRGVWFRVSLGLFSSIVEAKNYVVEHQTLFDGQDYVFIQFD